MYIIKMQLESPTVNNIYCFKANPKLMLIWTQFNLIFFAIKQFQNCNITLKSDYLNKATMGPNYCSILIFRDKIHSCENPLTNHSPRRS